MSKAQIPERDIEIFRRVHGGESYASESRRLGLSCGRIRQIFFKVSRRMGISGSTREVRKVDADYQSLTLNHLTGREKLYMMAVLSTIIVGAKP